MGEYAKDKFTGEEVKIGTCESMYYLRYEDRNKVSALHGNVDPATEKNLFWRLPFPDEDKIGIGNYGQYNRGLRLHQSRSGGGVDDFRDETTVENPGTIQLKHESGLLANIKCYHGEKLPESSADAQFHWNGKSHAYELAFIKNTDEGIKPVVRCRHCGSMWRYSWSEILPFIPDEEMRKRLAVYDKEIVKLATA